jgi:ATP-dependent helicase/nuclease subunit B
MSSSVPACRNIYSVPPNKPFVDVLAEHLLSEYWQTPDALARLLVLVPTRRSVTSLRDTLLRRSGGKPLLLPRIQPIGEIDLELAMPDVLWAEEASARPDIPPAISSRQRVFELARLIEAFQRETGNGVAADQSVLMAQALGDLIDDLAREQVPYARLENLVEGELAEHWQKTLKFLRIITDIWPIRLKELRRVDAVDRRSRILRVLADHWAESPPDFPVIAAGTTGSIPATAYLLEVISRLPQGRVILPGLDKESDDVLWQAMRRAVSHPQWGMQQLLKNIGCAREDVGVLDAPSVEGAAKARMDFLSAVMMPAELSHRWREMHLPEGALDGISMVECEDEEEESLAIALMLRDALETPDQQVMLVTHDRALARRVAVLLRRYRLEVEDGGGLPLLNTPPAVLAMLILRAAEAQAPADILALLKHPLCSLGVSPDVKFKSVCEIELAFYRGIRSGETLREQVARIPALENFSREATTCLTRLANALEPVTALFERSRVKLPEAQATLVEAMERLAEAPDAAASERLWSGQAGHLLSREMADIYDHSGFLGEVEPAAFGLLLARLLARESFQPMHQSHPRIAILSPMDARMQHADMVILAGLNEGCWPPSPQSDPWMSRAMRESVGLQPYERQIGQAAHDFISLCAAPRVILTRAGKVGGSAAMASRWWLRLATVLEAFPPQVRQEFMAQGKQWNAWAEEFRVTEHRITLARPRPVPPLEVRPRQIYVSQVEKLMRDPYAFYARYILRLKPLEPIDKEPGMSEFGDAVHKALELFTKRYPEHLPEQAESELTGILETCFADIIHRVRAPSFWRRRLQKLVRDVVEVERTRRRALRYVVSEEPMEAPLALAEGPCVVKAHIDRIDYRRDGSVDIIDYKTGAVPENKDVRAGYTPQLTLEGWLLQEAGEKVDELLYWKVPSGSKGEPLIKAGGVKSDQAALIAEARAGLERLLNHYDRAETPYACLADTSTAPTHNDYEHLERMEEWR